MSGAVSSSRNFSPVSSSGVCSPVSSSGVCSPVSSSGVCSHALSAQSSASASGAGSVAVGTSVRMSGGCVSAVLLPLPWEELEPMVVSVAAGWPQDVWIAWQRIGRKWWAVADPDLLLPEDGRGYKLVHHRGRYIAGCRDFDAEQALAHWSNPDHEWPVSAKLLHDAVAAHVESLGGVS